MPLHGKIVVIKKNGVDGVEFPLTASCLFGRKPDSDIRIQIPQVSKEHCRIDLNENKEVILTNLSKANPTRVNGEVLTQSERLKHGDTITIVDRSFRFEYPPAPTPKKRSSSGGKTETLKVRQDQQVAAAVCVGTADKRTSEVTTGAHLKDGGHHDNIQQSLEKTLEMESTEASQEQGKKNSPFSDLYHMIKKSLEIKTPCKSSASQAQTPSSKFCTPKPVSVRKSTDKPATPTPKKDQPKASGTPQTAKKQAKTFQVPAGDAAELRVEEPNTRSEGPSPKRRSSAAPQKFTALEIIEQISAQTPKSPARRRSKEATPTRAEAAKHQDEQDGKSPKAKSPGRASPGDSRKNDTVKEAPKKRKSGELGKDQASPQKRKRVSFGGQLSPELFDKRLPPNSPLRKGAAPRRSLVVFKPKSTLLRRASVIGLIKEQSPAKGRTPSPKKLKAGSPAQKSPNPKSATPKAASPGQKSPKSRSPSPKTPTQKSPKSKSATPKAASPAQKSPKSRSPSPKTPTQKSPKSRSATPKTPSPAQKSPKSRSASPKAKSLSDTSPKIPLNSGVQTPSVQGRFSVSRISTPSPTAEAVSDQEPLATPKIPIKRKSMKSSARKTPRAARSAAKLLQRRSGASRVSMKALTSWAGIVKFGKTKPQVVAPSKKKIPQKIKKKAAKCKPQTPARVPKGHMSTGHADSPATIVVGRAHKTAVAVGAAPRVVTNTILIKKNMKMDEDLTGISEMFKTPIAEKKRRSMTNDNKEVVKTPGGGLSASVMESVLSTPEESGEMIVSPLSVASAVKSRRYNSEAVQRLLDGEKSSFVGSGSTVKTAAVTTPKQKAPKPESLTGVKRIMKTPKQKPEPLEDLRGKILKTPKQKPEQRECLTGVKRIMKTPKHKAEPLEDLRGKILKTPKQKVEQQECLTGVKRIMKTPKHKAEPLEDLRGKLLKTPKQKPEPQECLTGVRRIFMTPKQKVNEDLRGKLSMTPKVEILDVSLDGVKELLKKPANDEATATKKIPRKKNSPVQDLVGVKRLMRTPKEKGEPVEENFGIKRLMKSPRLRGNPPVENFEGLQELMEEPPRDEQIEESMECAAQTTTEPDGVDDKNHSEMLNKSSIDDPSETADSLPLVDADVPQQPEADKINTDKVPEVDSSEKNKKSNRGRRPKAAESEEAEDRNEAPEEPAPILSARGRRVKKTEATASSAVRPARGRNTKILEEESTPQPSKAANKRGQKGQEVTEDVVIAENQEVDHQETSEMISKTKRAPVRAKRGRNAKHEDEEVGKISQNTTDSQQAVVEEKSEEMVAPEQEEPALVEAEPSKPRRGGRKAKQETESVIPAASTEDVMSVSTEKPVRGRRGKLVIEDAVAVQNQELEHQETEERVSGTKAVQNEAPVKPRRGRNAKHQDEEVEKISQDVTDSQQASVEEISNMSEEIVAPNQEEPLAEPSKPRRGGRKAKQDTESVTPAASTEVQEVLSASTNKPVRGRRAKHVTEDVVPVENQETEPKSENQETVEKVSRTKRAKAVQNEAPVRVKRGRNAKHEDEEVNKGITDSQQASVDKSEELVAQHQEEPAPVEAPTTKPRRGGRKAKQDTESVSPAASTEVQEVISVSSEKPVRGRRGKQVTENVIPAENQETEPEHQEKEETVVKSNRAKAAQDKAPVRAKRGRNAKHEEVDEVSQNITDFQQTVVEEKPNQSAEIAAANQEEPAAEPSKPRRGRKAKQDTESVTPAASTEEQEVTIVSSEKPMRGRRGKLVREDAITAEPEHLETEEKVTKPGRAKRAAQNEVPKAAPAKRARRGAAPPAEVEEDALSVPESAPEVAEPKAKRGRHAAAKQTPEEVSSDLTSPDEAESKKPARFVKWKADLEIFDIPKVTPVKATRGKKSKLDETKNPSSVVNKEEELSGETLPAKRGRRGVQGSDAMAASTSSSVLKENEPQPKARRGRPAKK
ncbi:proliferation marker protein Ki-67 isoform X3 [Oryzias melastigma]|uniref:proliferation marker protein Ki-67 isoform X3 n=1 Tax=Oryzias melastigma TaxID=30732 RepID=UPI00168CBCBB|nr:proliferation marker protein Ki-67 isoform X3 [Oryzias melastigma]